MNNLAKKLGWAAGLCLFLLLHCPRLAHSQIVYKKEEAARKPIFKKNIVKLNYLSLGIGSLSLFYERVINPNLSFQTGLLYTRRVSIFNNLTSGVAITPELRYYFSEKKSAPQGFFIGGFLRYTNYYFSSATSGYRIISIAGGILVGSQWILNRWLTIDVWGGPMYAFNQTMQDGNVRLLTPVLPERGPEFRIGSTLGIAF